jgi:hypothetical protein
MATMYGHFGSRRDKVWFRRILLRLLSRGRIVLTNVISLLLTMEVFYQVCSSSPLRAWA